jgi:hypothetical protein
MLSALQPSLFKFRIIDYDTRKGYDALARVSFSHDQGKESLAFVEFKRNLVTEFDHSFSHLAGIVCWDCTLADDESVKDIRGELRHLKITKPSAKNDHTKFMLVSNEEGHNIEVYVLKEFLKEKCGIELKVRPSE